MHACEREVKEETGYDIVVKKTSL
ncbi:hypothetical protein [Rossellomorea aquimaris]